MAKLQASFIQSCGGLIEGGCLAAFLMQSGH